VSLGYAGAPCNRIAGGSGNCAVQWYERTVCHIMWRNFVMGLVVLSQWE
jgi:hypothetical protein